MTVAIFFHATGSANLEPLVSDAVTEKDGEEGKGAYIAQLATVQKKSRKSQCLYFLLVIFAIIASK